MAPSSRQSAEGTDDGDRGTGGTRPSKLRHSLKFTWNHSVASPSGSGVKPESQSDAAYEVSYPLMKAFYSKYPLQAGLNFCGYHRVTLFSGRQPFDERVILDDETCRSGRSQRRSANGGS